jgi:hypothetical protein
MNFTRKARRAAVMDAIRSELHFLDVDVDAVMAIDPLVWERMVANATRRKPLRILGVSLIRSLKWRIRMSMRAAVRKLLYGGFCGVVVACVCPLLPLLGKKRATYISLLLGEWIGVRVARITPSNVVFLVGKPRMDAQRLRGHMLTEADPKERLTA